MIDNGKNPLIISGSGRSGTTWMLDVLAEVNCLRPVFEPLHPDAVPAAMPYANRYIEPDDVLPELKILFDKIFNGKFNSVWTDYRIRPHLLMPTLRTFSSLGKMWAFQNEWKSAIKRYFYYHKMIGNRPVLVKLIRGNLMLGWLRKNYDARIVFTVRHPGAIVESRLRISGPSWDPKIVLNTYRNCNFTGGMYERYGKLLESNLEPAEAHTLIWCIENQLPLECSVKDGYTLVFYEKLLSDGEHEWKRIIDALGLSKSPFGNQILSRPSQQSALHRKKQPGIKKTWLERLSEDDKRGIQRILDITGEKFYNIDSINPVSTNPQSII